MNHFISRARLAIALVVGPVALLATDPAPKPEPNPPTPPASAKPATPDAPAAASKDSEVLDLPKIEVTAHQTKELDREIKRLDKAIAREKKKVKATDLDKALNNPKLAQVGAIFGGNSSEHLEEVAASRVRYMETERELLTDMKQPRSLEELAMLKEELEKIRAMQRELDEAGH